MPVKGENAKNQIAQLSNDKNVKLMACTQELANELIIEMVLSSERL